MKSSRYFCLHVFVSVFPLRFRIDVFLGVRRLYLLSLAALEPADTVSSL